jgi:hypothetical protein
VDVDPETPEILRQQTGVRGFPCPLDPLEGHEAPAPQGLLIRTRRKGSVPMLVEASSYCSAS